MADYCTKAQVKARVEKTGSDADGVFDDLITAASRLIDGICRRPDGFVALTNATARQFSGSGKAWQWIDDCVSIAKVEVRPSVTGDYEEWTAADWIAARGDPEWPDFATPTERGKPYTLLLVDPSGGESTFTSGLTGTLRGFRPDPDVGGPRGAPTVRVTAKWGFAAAAPGPIREACVMQVARWWKRGQAAWADTVANGEMGMLMYRKELDPDIALVLMRGGYQRMAVG